jgi:hypothetical protein
MAFIFLILCLLAGSVFAESTIRVVPEMDYPIIDLESGIPLAKIKTECLPPRESDPVARCTVKKFGDLGPVDGKNYFYVLYEWLDQNELEDLTQSNQILRYPHGNTAVILFYSVAEAPNILRPFYSDRNDLNTGWFEEPKFIRRANGIFLQIPHRAATSAETEPDSLLEWREQSWHVIDTQSWLEDLQARLPQDCSVIQAPSINIIEMNAATMVWKDSDDHCCPTCGKVYSTLVLQEDRLVIKSLRYDVRARK